MARTTFSGPVRSGYKGGDASANQPLTPTTINAGSVIPVDQGTGSLRFLLQSCDANRWVWLKRPYQSPGEAYLLCLVEFRPALRLLPLPLNRLTTISRVVAGEFAVIGYLR
jgi:hypothetical protein